MLSSVQGGSERCFVFGAFRPPGTFGRRQDCRCSQSICLRNEQHRAGSTPDTGKFGLVRTALFYSDRNFK